MTVYQHLHVVAAAHMKHDEYICMFMWVWRRGWWHQPCSHISSYYYRQFLLMLTITRYYLLLKVQSYTSSVGMRNNVKYSIASSWQHYTTFLPESWLNSSDQLSCEASEAFCLGDACMQFMVAHLLLKIPSKRKVFKTMDPWIQSKVHNSRFAFLISLYWFVGWHYDCHQEILSTSASWLMKLTVWWKKADFWMFWLTHLSFFFFKNSDFYDIIPGLRLRLIYMFRVKSQSDHDTSKRHGRTGVPLSSYCSVELYVYDSHRILFDCLAYLM